MVTVCAQLASVIAHAEAIGAIDKLAAFTKRKTAKLKTRELSGVPCVSGVGIGKAVVVYPLADLKAVPDREAENIHEEIKLFEQAVQATHEDIQQMSKRMLSSLPSEEHALFDVYLRILDSPTLSNEVITEIKKGQWAQGALRLVITRHIKHFVSMDDEYLRERASDFRDLGRRLLSHLQKSQKKVIEHPEQTILVGDDVSAANLAEVPEGCLAGIVSSTGSSAAHVAILARALGIPTVMSAKGMPMSELAGLEIVVDGYFGQVYVSPKKSLLKQYLVLAADEKELDESLQALRYEPAETPDNHRISLCVNTGMAGDATLALSVGGDGVGLYRSEVSFMTRDSFPTEKEQRVIYRQLLKAFAPRPVTMRTLDIGGDKMLPYFPVEEKNPYLGWRGIRITLDHPDIFLIQLRAMIRANIELNNLQILFPMITGVGELDEALALIEQAYAEVKEEEKLAVKPSIGAMIEIPSAVYQAKELAKRVDFLSVGSNDLTQYLLAVDRNNARVAGLYDPLHPAMIRALVQVVEGAHGVGKLVGICGEMASDPCAVILLLAMGFDSLSMNSASLPRVKWVVRNFTMAKARQLLSEIIEMESPTLIRFQLEKAIDAAGLGGLIRAGKG